MKLFSLDTETTGLDEHVQLVQFALVPVDTVSREIRTDLAFEKLVKCSSYEYLEPSLSPWVKDNNKEMIIEAHQNGIEPTYFRQIVDDYIGSLEISKFLNGEQYGFLTKSAASLDFPLLGKKHYLGWEGLRTITRKVIDVADIARFYIDKGLLPHGTDSSKNLMKHFGFGEDVEHTALADAVQMTEIYFKLLDL